MLRIQFPWYNFTFLREEYAALGLALSKHLRAQGWTDLPDQLDPSFDLDEVLTSPYLLVSQTCGYDLAIEAPGPLTPLLTPTFAAPGCGPGTYRSFVVVNRESRARSLIDLYGARFVANDNRSWSGYHCLRDHHASFSRIEFSGGHVESLASLRGHAADVAAIDCVTWEFLRRHRPRALDPLRVIGQTEAAPAPPLVTAAGRSVMELRVLRGAFKDLLRDEPALCARLLIEDFVKLDAGAYAYMSASARSRRSNRHECVDFSPLDYNVNSGTSLTENNFLPARAFKYPR